MRDPEIVVADITTLAVDAIVNAANESLAPGGGVCGAIHRAAGPGLAVECAGLGGCAVGDAKATDGHDLRARRVIHAVGPVYRGGSQGEDALLAAAYRRSLDVAHEQGLKSIAFPCISTGIFGYPKEEAAAVALAVCTEWLSGDRQPLQIILCCFDESDARIYRRLMAERSRDH